MLCIIYVTYSYITICSGILADGSTDTPFVGTTVVFVVVVTVVLFLIGTLVTEILSGSSHAVALFIVHSFLFTSHSISFKISSFGKLNGSTIPVIIANKIANPKIIRCLSLYHKRISLNDYGEIFL